jgi:hypothetical protein
LYGCDGNPAGVIQRLRVPDPLLWNTALAVAMFGKQGAAMIPLL